MSSTTNLIELELQYCAKVFAHPSLYILLGKFEIGAVMYSNV